MSRSSWTSEPREPGADGVRRALQLLDRQVAALAVVDAATPLTKSGEKPYRECRVALRGLLERLGLEDPLPFPDLATSQRRHDRLCTLPSAVFRLTLGQHDMAVAPVHLDGCAVG